jgi:hypothetical protein
MTSVRKDFIASHIRSQIATLQDALGCIESAGLFEEDCASELLKKVEMNLRQLRKFGERN